MSQLHFANIIVHVTAGSIAILLGLILLLRRKGDRTHRRLGRVTAIIAGIGIAVALFGAVVFRGKTDLLGVSLLTGYQIWSGVRAIRLRRNGRSLPDLVPASGLLIACGTLYFIWRSGGAVNWEPARVYASLGSMAFFGAWDVLRILFPSAWRIALNPAEHAFKLTCFIGALMSVASATLLPQIAVYATMVSSSLFLVVALVFAVRAARYAVGVVPNAALKARLNADSEL